MYLLNTPAVVEWTLGKTPNTVLITELLTITVKPDGSTAFAQVQNLIAPTETTQGEITHTFTPDTEGLWEITLVKGTADTYTTLSKAIMYVFDNDTIVEPVDYNPDSLDIIGV